MSPSSLVAFVAASLALSTGVAANDVLRANPSSANIGLTTGASDWLWAVFAIMLLSTLAFMGWHFRLRRGARVFHQLPILILTTATIAYFSMASNLGNTPIRTEFGTSHLTRAIWYVRYIAWVIITPLLLLELLLGTGLALSDIVTVIFMAVVSVVTRLVGALVASRYKWGFFTISVFCLFYVLWVLMGPGRATASLLGVEHRRAYTKSAIFLSVLWLLYPICWGLSEGSNAISITGEMIFYGVLDILTMPVLCFMHVSALRNIPMESFGFNNFHTGLNNTNNGAFTGRHGEKSGMNNSSAMANQDTVGTHATDGTTTNLAGHSANPVRQV